MSWPNAVLGCVISASAAAVIWKFFDIIGKS
jgi:hypothetical protein